MASAKLVSIFVVLGAMALPPAAVDAADAIPRTPEGRPDLTGYYDVATLTPLTRPTRFGDNLYLTPEEARRIEEEERELLARGLEPSDPDRAAPPVGGAAPVGFDDSQRETLGAGNVGGYNSFWIDRGEEVLTVDGKLRTSIITDPPNGRYPPLTPEGQKRAAERRARFRPNDGTPWWLEEEGPGPYDDPELRPLGERCLLGFGSTHGPPMLPVLYNNHKRIVQTPDHVMILGEMIHDARIIRLSSEHAPPDVRFWLGDSIGWWEGDTLVVDTTNFRDETGLSLATRDLHVVERFTLRDADTLHYEFTVEDPSTWTAPWTGDYVWDATDQRVYEYACHEGNYALGNVLRGARLLEAEAEQKHTGGS